MDNQKRELTNRDEIETKKGKNGNEILVEHRIIEEIADQGNIDPPTTQDTPDMKPEELVEGEFIDMNEESVCDTKHEGVL